MYFTVYGVNFCHAIGDQIESASLSPRVTTSNIRAPFYSRPAQLSHSFGLHET